MWIILIFTNKFHYFQLHIKKNDFRDVCSKIQFYFFKANVYIYGNDMGAGALMSFLQHIKRKLSSSYLLLLQLKIPLVE